MDSKKLTKLDISDLSTADVLANQIFRCSYHTFMTEIKIPPDFSQRLDTRSERT